MRRVSLSSEVLARSVRLEHQSILCHCWFQSLLNVLLAKIFCSHRREGPLISVILNTGLSGCPLREAHTTRSVPPCSSHAAVLTSHDVRCGQDWADFRHRQDPRRRLWLSGAGREVLAALAEIDARADPVVKVHCGRGRGTGSWLGLGSAPRLGPASRVARNSFAPGSACSCGAPVKVTLPPLALHWSVQRCAPAHIR